MPNNIRRHPKALFAWRPKERADLMIIYDENNVVIDDELGIV